MPKPKSSIISAVGWRSASAPTLPWPAPHASLVTDGAAAVSSAVRTLGVATREIGHTCDASRLGHDGIRGRHRWPRLSIHRDRNDLNLATMSPGRVQRWGRGTFFVRGMTDK